MVLFKGSSRNEDFIATFPDMTANSASPSEKRALDVVLVPRLAVGGGTPLVRGGAAALRPFEYRVWEFIL